MPIGFGFVSAAGRALSASHPCLVLACAVRGTWGGEPCRRAKTRLIIKVLFVSTSVPSVRKPPTDVERNVSLARS